MLPDCVLDGCARDFVLIFIFPGRMRGRGFNSCRDFFWLFLFFLKLLRVEKYVAN